MGPALEEQLLRSKCHHAKIIFYDELLGDCTTLNLLVCCKSQFSNRLVCSDFSFKIYSQDVSIELM